MNIPFNLRFGNTQQLFNIRADIFYAKILSIHHQKNIIHVDRQFGEQFITGKKGATAEITVYTDDTSAGPQYNIIKALHTGVTVRVFIGVLSGSTASEGDAFTAVVTAVSDTNDNGSVASRSISLTATGSVTHYPTIS